VISCKDKILRIESVAKASLNRANKYGVLDAKPCDLAMVRMKFG
jgi:hypothetical protein